MLPSHKLHLNIGDKEVDILIQGEMTPSLDDSIRFGGRDYLIQCPADQKDVVISILKNVIQEVKPQDFSQLKKKAIELTNASKLKQVKTISKVTQPVINPNQKVESDTIIKGEIAKKMDAHLELIHDLFNFSGTVLVKKDGETILRKGYGLANIESPNTSSTVFQIASLTKQFTATAILKLIEEGETSGEENPIKLHDPISKHLSKPLYSDKWEGVTIHQLLCHQSGLLNNDECPDFKKDQEKKLNEKKTFEPRKGDLFDYFKNIDLKKNKEGEETHYSNFGYYILGAIIEEHTDKPYGDFISTILPDEMKKSGYYKDNKYSNSDLNIATGFHLNNNQEIEPHIGAVATEAYSAGGLYSTVDDLAVWNKALLSGKVIKKDFVNLMKMPHGTDKKQNQNFGYGLEVDEVLGRKAVFHGGVLDGFKAQNCTFLNENSEKMDMIIILSNDFDVPEINIRNNLAAILNNQAFVNFSNKSVDDNFPEGKKFYLGKEEKHSFIKENGKFIITSPPPQKKEGEKEIEGEKCLLVPLENGRYLNIRHGLEWEFAPGIATAYGRAGPDGKPGAKLGTLTTEPKDNYDNKKLDDVATGS